MQVSIYLLPPAVLIEFQFESVTQPNFVTGLFILLFVDLRASAQWGFVQGSQAGVIFVFVVVGVMAVWAAVMLYSFSMLSRYDNKIIFTLKNSLIISVNHLPQTIIMLIATVGLTYFSCLYFTAFIVTIPLILYVDSYIFSSIFKQLEKESVPSVQEAGTEEDTNEDKEEEE